jgi:hypothetical protein
MPNKDLEFLTELNKKLVKIVDRTFTPNLSGIPFDYKVREYTDKKINKITIKKIIKTVNDNGFVFYPIDSEFGFYPAYQISENENKKVKVLLTFSERQCPEKYKWDKLSEVFMNDKNLQRLKEANIQIDKKDSYYY